ncbi:MAG: hypothetical protein KGL38_10850 [Gemmatimonadota bacterium]|nr:hypothetical protein [Gemmatimonadota bacterium]MDE3128496.1 hypothetical protein [Gemmatimonadota bacterium]MDE3174013.1 hypothetical protein [Gemmatimonadota bacterium]MDE3217091.1 hypothetical protein [Gemmatimonadota bacterium]
MARQRPKSSKKRGPKRGRPKGTASAYYVQPGKHGAVIVLRKPCGNRATPKVCGVMPSRAHAQALVGQLERAETAVNDLFYEATDDGIEALEAVLAACRDAVLRKLPVSAARVEEMQRANEPGEIERLPSDPAA